MTSQTTLEDQIAEAAEPGQREYRLAVNAGLLTGSRRTDAFCIASVYARQNINDRLVTFDTYAEAHFSLADYMAGYIEGARIHVAPADLTSFLTLAQLDTDGRDIEGLYTPFPNGDEQLASVATGLKGLYQPVLPVTGEVQNLAISHPDGFLLVGYNTLPTIVVASCPVGSDLFAHEPCSDLYDPELWIQPVLGMTPFPDPSSGRRFRIAMNAGMFTEPSTRMTSFIVPNEFDGKRLRFDDPDDAHVTIFNWQRGAVPLPASYSVGPQDTFTYEELAASRFDIHLGYLERFTPDGKYFLVSYTDGLSWLNLDSDGAPREGEVYAAYDEEEAALLLDPSGPVPLEHAFVDECPDYLLISYPVG
jgi:hypothetical protein